MIGRIEKLEGEEREAAAEVSSHEREVEADNAVAVIEEVLTVSPRENVEAIVREAVKVATTFRGGTMDKGGAHIATTKRMEGLIRRTKGTPMAIRVSSMTPSLTR